MTDSTPSPALPHDSATHAQAGRGTNAPARRAAPFGSWVSPITTDLIVGATIRLGQPAFGAGGVVWTEGRPAEQGRTVLVRYPLTTPSASVATRDPGETQGPEDMTPAPFNVRTLVHEYGGGAYVADTDAVWFSAFGDQQIYGIDRIDQAGAHAASEASTSGAPTASSASSGSSAPDRAATTRALPTPRQITHEANVRFADAIVDHAHGRLICVAEDHRGTAHEPVNTLVSVALSTGAMQVLVDGHDFFSSPALRADGQQLAWLSWDHPNMPWDGTQLWLADLDADGALGNVRCIAGGADESIFQPAWSPSGELHFVSDRSGWWNLYRVRNGVIEALYPCDAEFGTPQWQFGTCTYGFDAQGRIVCLYAQDGDTHLAILDADAHRLDEIATPFRAMRDLRIRGDQAVFVGSSPTAHEAIVLLELGTRTHRVLREASSAHPDPADISIAQAIRFPTTGGLEAHALFYAPANAAFEGPPDARPPLLVFSHGGPTSSTDAALKWSIQYWTSRGFAVVDVNYGGSSGYGRAYRSRLERAWGVVDVDDCVNAARYLIEQGRVDGERVAIRGGSAGGYTTLCALTFRTFFKAGASHYGIGDLEALARDTHKFESRYLERLVGRYPQEQARYRERSPVHHADRLSSAMILFQGAEDKAVPPNQAEAMYNAVRAKGLPVAYLLFEHEQHGFRRADTIRRAYEAELYFYGRIFGFTPADVIEPVEIDNL